MTGSECELEPQLCLERGYLLYPWSLLASSNTGRRLSQDVLPLLPPYEEVSTEM